MSERYRNATEAVMKLLLEYPDGLTMRELCERSGYMEGALRSAVSPLVEAGVIEAQGGRPKQYRLSVGRS